MLKNIYKRAALAVTLLLAMASSAICANRMYCTGGYIAPGETGEVSIALDNDEDCFGFQADIQIPDDWEFVTANGKVLALLTDRADDSYTIVSKLTDSRNLRIGAFSTKHIPFSGNSGALLTLKVKALAGFTSGTVAITNAIMVNKEDHDVELENSSVLIKPVPVESIILSQTTAVLKVGESVSLTATVLPADATDKTVTWNSSNETVATVDGSGLVSILAEGTCVITVTANDGSEVEAQCIITGLSGIDEIFVDGEVTADVYTPGGVLLKKGCDKAQLHELSAGAYIIRYGKKVVKLIVK